MNDPIRWGILCTARISHQFARDFAHAGGGKLLAVASRAQEAAQAFAAQHGIPRAYGSYEALLADPDIDAVYVSTPHTLHLPNSLAAIAAGKAVLCEKPLTVNPAEAEELVAAAAAAGVYLMEAMWTWHLPAVRTALDWVKAGRIGRLQRIEADFGFRATYDPASRVYARELAGGCLLDLGVYPIALAWLLMRSDPEAIQVVHQLAPNGVEDEVSMRFDYGAVRAEMTASFRQPLSNGARIVGDEGVIELPDFWRARQCVLSREGLQADRFEDGRLGDGFEFEIEAVNQDLQSGRTQSPVVTWDDSLAFQRHMARVFAEMGIDPG